MGKVKQLETDQVENKISEIVNKIVKSILTKNEAIKKLNKIENIELVIDKNNIEEYIDWAIDDTDGKEFIEQHKGAIN